MKIGFVSLGCSKNLTDTEVMLYKLNEAGYEITPNAEEAEVIVLNTCGFIESAKAESIENIIDLASLKEEGNLKPIYVGEYTGAIKLHLTAGATFLITVE